MVKIPYHTTVTPSVNNIHSNAPTAINKVTKKLMSANILMKLDSRALKSSIMNRVLGITRETF